MNTVTHLCSSKGNNGVLFSVTVLLIVTILSPLIVGEWPRRDVNMDYIPGVYCSTAVSNYNTSMFPGVLTNL